MGEFLRQSTTPVLEPKSAVLLERAGKGGLLANTYAVIKRTFLLTGFKRSMLETKDPFLSDPW